jgi:hypothetical protein
MLARPSLTSMSLAQIEAELENLTPEELRRLAARSWHAFLEKTGGNPAECDEDDSSLLAALDASLHAADAAPGTGHTAQAVRARLRPWITK